MIEYEKLLSSTIQQIKPSGIRKFFDLAENMEESSVWGWESRISRPLG